MGTFQKKSDSNRALVQGLVSGLILLKDVFLFPQESQRLRASSVNEIFNEIARRDAMIREGYEIIPDKLYIRYTSSEDITRIKNSNLIGIIGRLPIENREALVEYYSDQSEGVFTSSPNIIDNTLLALRLLKPEIVFIHKYWMISYDGKSGGLEGTVDPLFGSGLPYLLEPEDIEDLKKVLFSLEQVDFDKNVSYQIACDRFNKSYSKKYSWDQIIDLCIGFEALYCKGEKVSGSKGDIIGLACSMLLGKNHTEREEINENIKTAYKFRNDVVHGSLPDYEKIFEIEPLITDYLRKSILKLMPD